MRLLLSLLFISIFTHAGKQASNSLFPFEKIKSELSPRDQNYIKKLPKHVIYDWIQVPENYLDPQGRKIKVFYEYRLPKNKDKKLRPICFFYGGPGLDPRSSIPALIPIIKDHGVIIIHQRGTGLSSPLPQIKSETDVLRLKNYLSRAIVEDAEIIRKKLFSKNKWIVAGQSFGSLIIQRYISMYPESLYSAHAHGFAATSLPTPFAESRILKHKDVLKAYLEKFPKDKKRLEFIAQKCQSISFSPKGEPDIIIKGRHTFSFIGMVFLSSPTYWKDLSNILTMICPENSVDVHKLRLVITNFYFNKSFIYLGKEQDALNVVFNRHEAYVTNPKQSLSLYYQATLNKLKKSGINTDSWPLGEEALMHFCIDSPIHNLADNTDLGPADPLLPKDIADSLHKNKQLKLFLYAGKIDSIAPPETFSELKQQCGDQMIFTILPGGHDSFLSTQFWKEVFIDTVTKQ